MQIFKWCVKTIKDFGIKKMKKKLRWKKTERVTKERKRQRKKPERKKKKVDGQQKLKRKKNQRFLARVFKSKCAYLEAFTERPALSTYGMIRASGDGVPLEENHVVNHLIL